MFLTQNSYILFTSIPFLLFLIMMVSGSIYEQPQHSLDTYYLSPVRLLGNSAPKALTMDRYYFAFLLKLVI